MAKIGVFDSGVGGQSVATAINFALPDDEVVVVQDHINVPYGTKTEKELYSLALPLIQKLVNENCQIIVIACNTISTTILDKLIAVIPVPLIGVEPMVRQAAQITKNKIMVVCATPRTLQSRHYKKLCGDYAKGIVLIEPDCSEWAFMIEQDNIDKTRIKIIIQDALEQGADAIVLGCTHYHWIESLIKTIAGDLATVLQPEQLIIQDVKKELRRLS